MNPNATLYRTRAVTVEARQIIAEDWERCEHIASWCGGDLVDIEAYRSMNDSGVMWLQGEQGWFVVDDGDWVVKGPRGFFCVKDHDFASLYEPALPL